MTGPGSHEPVGPIRVLLAEDQQPYREGLRAALERDGGFDVVGEAADGSAAIDLWFEHLPDVTVMDVMMPTMGGAAATRLIREQAPEARILMVSVVEDEPEVLAAMKAGATGYMLKSEPTDRLMAGIRDVAAGNPVFTASLAGMILHEFHRMADAVPELPPGERLTNAELEVLRLIAKGKRYRDIAAERFVQTKTIQNQAQSIMAKLHVHSKYELMRIAFMQGLAGDGGPNEPT